MAGIAMGGSWVVAGGVSSLGGLESMGARVYDRGSRGFLSVDPLDPVAGAGWSGNPYSFAGNDPVGALDPQGLRPVSPKALQDYNEAHPTSVVGVAKKFVEEHPVATALIVAGIGTALLFTPLAGIGAEILIGEGTSLAVDVGSQVISNSGDFSQIDWDHTAKMAALGGATGPIGGAVAKGAVQMGKSLVTTEVGASLMTKGSGMINSFGSTSTVQGVKNTAARFAPNATSKLGNLVQNAVKSGAPKQSAESFVDGGIQNTINYNDTNGPHDGTGYATAFLVGGASKGALKPIEKTIFPYKLKTGAHSRPLTIKDKMIYRAQMTRGQPTISGAENYLNYWGTPMDDPHRYKTPDQAFGKFWKGSSKKTMSSGTGANTLVNQMKE